MSTTAIETATTRAVQQYLARARRERWETIGEARRAWVDICGPIVAAIVAECTRSVTAAVVSEVDHSAFEAMVWNRIVSIELPDAVFSQLITITTRGQTLGWPTATIARRIAVDLGWSLETGYWDAQRAQAEAALETRLAGLTGEARDYVRTTDPVVRELQDDMAEATRKAASEYSEWQYKAERIARTETSSAANFSALRQLQAEGWTHKQWVAGLDARTRPSHREADGQVVPIDGYFTVGGYSLAMPGEYGAPAAEVINCRCTLVGTMGDTLG